MSGEPCGGTVALRSWGQSDADELVEIYGDGALRRWTSADLRDLAGAQRWIRDQERGWETGERFGFAVVEGDPRRLVGHVVVKDVVPGSGSAEVGYWTAARARGRGIAPKALRQVTGWAFANITGLTRLNLLHQVDNTASCRVAVKSGYRLVETLRAAPPAFPLNGHRHLALWTGPGSRGGGGR
jgi:RimJ/RimL family protein N-acetyltransferase